MTAKKSPETSADTYSELPDGWLDGAMQKGRDAAYELYKAKYFKEKENHGPTKTKP